MTTWTTNTWRNGYDMGNYHVLSHSDKDYHCAVDCGADIPVVFLMNVKSIFREIARKLGFFMTSSEKRRKEKFFEDMQTHSQEMEDKEEILCSMHEDYDEVDYKAADHLDEVAEIERMRKDK